MDEVVCRSYWGSMFVKKMAFFYNLFFLFNRNFYNKSTNSCIIIAGIIMYNFNIITIFSTMIWEHRRKSYLFITWIPSCWQRIIVLIYKSGEKLQLDFWFLLIQRKQERTSSLLCCSLVDCHDSENLIRPTMLGVRDDRGPGLGAGFKHVQHLVNLASDRAIFLEVPQLIGATVGLKKDRTAVILVHIQHQSGHKDSTLQNSFGFW